MNRMTRARARSEMMHELERLQEELNARWLEQCLPEDWNGLDSHLPPDRHKTRVTVRLDSDMVRWFRKTGPGYGARINAILRIYWTGLMCGHVRAFIDEDTTPRMLAYARDVQRRLREGRPE